MSISVSLKVLRFKVNINFEQIIKRKRIFLLITFIISNEDRFNEKYVFIITVDKTDKIDKMIKPPKLMYKFLYC